MRVFLDANIPMCHGVARVATFDKGFDRFPDLHRLS
jgi:predicted nucleic acid-binding protein